MHVSRLFVTLRLFLTSVPLQLTLLALCRLGVDILFPDGEAVALLVELKLNRAYDYYHKSRYFLLAYLYYGEYSKMHSTRSTFFGGLGGAVCSEITL